MRRKLFFLLEKLEIKRSERIAILSLLILLVMASGFLTFHQPFDHNNEEQYRELEKVFKEKSKELRQEREVILARYEPDRELLPAGPELKETEPEITEPDTADQSTEQNSPGRLLNINTATSEQLQELPGIGPAYAGRIVAWREENGAFTSRNQLLEIKGIGEKRLAKIKPLITL